MFELNHVAYYRKVPTFNEPTETTISNETVVEFWNNLYRSKTATQEYLKVVEKPL